MNHTGKINVRTSTAARHGFICPKCKDDTTQDPQGRGFVRHKNNRNCSFEKGERDFLPPSSYGGTPRTP